MGRGGTEISVNTPLPDSHVPRSPASRERGIQEERIRCSHLGLELRLSQGTDNDRGPLCSSVQMQDGAQAQHGHESAVSSVPLSFISALVSSLKSASLLFLTVCQVSFCRLNFPVIL